MKITTQMMGPIAGNDYAGAIASLTIDMIDTANGAALDWDRATTYTEDHAGDIFLIALEVPEMETQG